MKRRRELVTPPEPGAGERGLDFAWRTHIAITDWTAKVDTKSSIMLSVGGAALGFIITLTGHGRLLADLHHWRLGALRVGIGALALGVVLAAFAVWPRLKRQQAKRIWRDNYVYFGHLRHWDPADLQRVLRRQTIDDQLDVLSKQLVTTSKISWNKHATLQGAMFFMLAGIVMVTTGVVWP